MSDTPPKLAILFWYYKEPDICADRLRLLCQLNKNIPIYGLYGGELADFPAYQTALKAWLDDNWTFPETKQGNWKWRHGDLMLSAWQQGRGRHLQWDTLVVMQWDMLALAPVNHIFHPLEKNEIYLPGLRPMEELEPHWWWVRPGTSQGDEYSRFKAQLAERYAFFGPYQACQFITAALPRTFLDSYAQIPEPELGFLEYKLPAYANLFGTPIRELPHLRVTWPGEWHRAGRVTLTAAKREIRDMDIIVERLTPGGARLFHPVSRPFPSESSGLIKLMLQGLARATLDRIRKKFTHSRGAEK